MDKDNKDKKRPKKSLVYYYIVILIIAYFFNVFIIAISVNVAAGRA